MKKINQFALAFAIAVTGAGFSACSSTSDDVTQNPNYNPETNEVITKFMFNVSSGNNTTYGNNQSAPEMTEGITRQSSAAVQATDEERFRGIEHAVLFTTKQGSDGKHLAAAAAMAKRFDLSRIVMAGALDKEKTSRVIETSLPLNTNTLLFYGKAIEGTASAAEAEEGLTAYDLYGHLDKFQVGADDEESLDLGASTFELSSRINGNLAKYQKIEELLAGILTCIMNTNLSGANHVELPAARYAFDVSVDDYPATLTWADYNDPNGKSPVETTHVLYPLEVKLGDAYREMTNIKQADGELRAGGERHLLAKVVGAPPPVLAGEHLNLAGCSVQRPSRRQRNGNRRHYNHHYLLHRYPLPLP